MMNPEPHYAHTSYISHQMGAFRNHNLAAHGPCVCVLPYSTHACIHSHTHTQTHTVDSTPHWQGPPSTTSSTRPPRSSSTCCARVGEGRPLLLALEWAATIQTRECSTCEAFGGGRPLLLALEWAAAFQKSQCATCEACGGGTATDVSAEMSSSILANKCSTCEARGQRRSLLLVLNGGKRVILSKSMLILWDDYFPR